MATKLRISKKRWVDADGIKIEIGKIDKLGGFNCRLFLIIDGEKFDFVNPNYDIYVTEKGSLTINTSEGFKIKRKVEIK